MLTSEVPQIKDHVLFNFFYITWKVQAFQMFIKMLDNFFWWQIEVDV